MNQTLPSTETTPQPSDYPHSPYVEPHASQPSVQGPSPFPVAHQLKPGRTSARVSLLLGLISLVLWFIPFAGFVPPALGLVCSNVARQSAPRSEMAMMGLVFSWIGLGLATISTLVFLGGLIGL